MHSLPPGGRQVFYGQRALCRESVVCDPGQFNDGDCRNRPAVLHSPFPKNRIREIARTSTMLSRARSLAEAFSGAKSLRVQTLQQRAASAAPSCDPAASAVALASTSPEIPRITPPCTCALYVAFRKPRPSIRTASASTIVLAQNMRGLPWFDANDFVARPRWSRRECAVSPECVAIKPVSSRFLAVESLVLAVQVQRRNLAG